MDSMASEGQSNPLPPQNPVQASLQQPVSGQSLHSCQQSGIPTPASSHPNPLNQLSAILESMQDLMSRHKAFALSPRDCLRTSLFQRWIHTPFRKNSRSRGQLPNIGLQISSISPGPVPTTGNNPLVVQVGEHQSFGQNPQPVSQQSVSMTNSMPSTIQSKLASGTTMNQVAAPHSQTMTTTSTSNMSLQQSGPRIAQPMQQQTIPSPFALKVRSIIWEGILEFKEKPLPADYLALDQSAPHLLPCTFSSMDPDVNADKWPNHLMLQLIPSRFMLEDNLLRRLKTTARYVRINAVDQKSVTLPKLGKIMRLDWVGCIQFPTTCNISIMVVLYMPGKEIYMGLIASDQDSFLQDIKQKYKTYEIQQLQQHYKMANSLKMDNLEALESGKCRQNLIEQEDRFEKRDQTETHCKEVCELELLHPANVDNNDKIQSKALKTLSSNSENGVLIRQLENIKELDRKTEQLKGMEKLSRKSSSDCEGTEKINTKLDHDRINKDLRHKLANLEASHFEEIDALYLKFEEFKFDWIEKTEKLIMDLYEKHEEELTELQNKLSKEHSEKLYKQNEVHLKELLEGKVLHKNEMNNAEICYESKIRDLNEQLISENSKKEAIERQLENREREFLNRLEVNHNIYTKEMKMCEKNNARYKTKLRHSLAENIKLKREIDEKNVMQKRYEEDIKAKERLICLHKSKIEVLEELHDELSKKHSRDLYKQNKVHLKELSEKELLHSDEMSSVEKYYKNLIQDLEEEVIHKESEREALGRQLEDKEREFKNAFQDCHNMNDENLRFWKGMYSQLETKLRQVLEENERLKIKVHKNDSYRVSCIVDIDEKERIISQLKNELEQLKNAEDLSQNSCSNCKGTEEIKKKIISDLDQNLAKITSLEAKITSLVQTLKKLREPLSHKIAADCMTNGSDSESNKPEKNEDDENKGKSVAEFETVQLNASSTQKKYTREEEEAMHKCVTTNLEPTQKKEYTLFNSSRFGTRLLRGLFGNKTGSPQSSGGIYDSPAPFNPYTGFGVVGTNTNCTGVQSTSAGTSHFRSSGFGTTPLGGLFRNKTESPQSSGGIFGSSAPFNAYTGYGVLDAYTNCTGVQSTSAGTSHFGSSVLFSNKDDSLNSVDQENNTEYDTDEEKACDTERNTDEEKACDTECNTDEEKACDAQYNTDEEIECVTEDSTDEEKELDTEDSTDEEKELDTEDSTDEEIECVTEDSTDEELECVTEDSTDEEKDLDTEYYSTDEEKDGLSHVGGTQMQGHQLQNSKIDDAISYLDEVKYKYENQPQVYNEFLNIIKEYKSQSIDTLGVIERLSNLFRGHLELIVGFNTYLPPGYRIEVEPNEQVEVSIPGANLAGGAISAPTSLTIHPGGSPTATLHSTHSSQSNNSSPSTSPHSSPGNALNQSHVGGTQMQVHQLQKLEVDHAHSYLDQVKYKYGDQPQVYNDFLALMMKYKSDRIDTLGVIQRLSNLFRGHPELIVGYNAFLPPGYRIEVKPNEKVEVSIPGTNLGGGATSAPTSLTIHPGGPPTTTIHSTSFISNHSSPSTSPHSSPGNGVNKSHVGGTQMQGHQLQKSEVNHARLYLDQVKYKYENQPQVYNDFLDLMDEYKSESIDTLSVIQRLSNLFRGHPELIVGFNTFLPLGYNIEVEPNEQVEVSIPGANLGGGAISAPTSLTIYPGGPPTTTIHSTSSLSNHSSHSTSPHSSPGNAANKVHYSCLATQDSNFASKVFQPWKKSAAQMEYSKVGMHPCEGFFRHPFHRNSSNRMEVVSLPSSWVQVSEEEYSSLFQAPSQADPELQTHESSCSKLRPFVCKICNKHFDTSSSLSLHEEENHTNSTDCKKIGSCLVSENGQSKLPHLGSPSHGIATATSESSCSKLRPFFCKICNKHVILQHTHKSHQDTNHLGSPSHGIATATTAAPGSHGQERCL